MKKRQLLGCCIGVLMLVLSPWLIASGAFTPSTLSGPGNALFSQGKAIFSGRIGSKACIDCHKSFKRSRLKKMNKLVSDIIVDCQLHKPCFKELSGDQLKALNAYFKRRYRL